MGLKLTAKHYARLVRDISKNYLQWHRRFVPRFLGLETTTLCNAGCSYCARFQTPDLTKTPFMDFELLKAIVDAVPFVSKVAPYGRGEPLLYPHIVDAIKYITDSGKTSLLYSNGSIFNAEQIAGLFEAGLTELSFSIDTDRPDEFEQLRGLSFKKVVNNVRRIAALRDDFGVDTIVRIRSCVGDFNASRFTEIKEFWMQFVDNVIPMPYIPFPTPDVFEKKPTMNTGFLMCRQMYDALNVRADGSVPFCCNDWYSCIILGHLDEHVTKERVLSLYNSPKASLVRKSIEFGRDAPALCGYCQVGNRTREMREMIE